MMGRVCWHSWTPHASTKSAAVRAATCQTSVIWLQCQCTGAQLVGHRTLAQPVSSWLQGHG